MTPKQKEVPISEEDLDTLLTLDDPGEEEADAGCYLQVRDTAIGGVPYPKVFSQGDWACAVCVVE